MISNLVFRLSVLMLLLPLFLLPDCLFLRWNLPFFCGGGILFKFHHSDIFYCQFYFPDTHGHDAPVMVGRVLGREEGQGGGLKGLPSGWPFWRAWSRHPNWCHYKSQSPAGSPPLSPWLHVFLVSFPSTIFKLFFPTPTLAGDLAYCLPCLDFLFLAAPCGLQDLSSLTRDRTQALAVKMTNPNHWTAREFPCLDLLIESVITPYRIGSGAQCTNEKVREGPINSRFPTVAPIQGTVFGAR